MSAKIRPMLRRDFLELGALPLLPTSGSQTPKKSCILLILTGGPSHLDTWDMKPEAPSHIRGPFRPIRTNVPGIEISEIFPRMARRADKFALVRSVYYDGPAVHATGYQLMQTHASHVTLGGLRFNTGGAVAIRHPVTPLKPESSRLRAQYGLNAFGQNCLKARQLVEEGARFVTVYMFDSVFDQPTWDSHGSKPFSSIADYATTVGPMFDIAYSSLLDDLDRRGMLETTMVVGMGEFGRGPKINPSGGRDHWPQCFTIHMAGGGVQGGRIYGSSDRTGAEPSNHPVTPPMILATIHHALGIPAAGKPILELFG